MQATRVILLLNLLLAQQSMGSSNRDRKVVIIGAGISGLAAAKQLVSKYGFSNVWILEATNRIGGRIYPIEFENDYLQIGAEFIHGRDNPVYRLARRLRGLVSGSEAARLDNQEYYYYNADGCVLDEDLMENFEKFYEDAEANLEELAERVDRVPDSVGALYEELFERFIREEHGGKTESRERYKPLLKFTQRLVEGEHACRNWNEMSFRTWSQYVEKPREEEITIRPFCYRRILDHFGASLPANRILLSTKVSHIDWTQAPVQIRTADARTLTADHVIVTLPLGHLKKYSDTLFSPSLPREKRRAIQDMGFDTLDKYFLVFDTPFWPSDAQEINLIPLNEAGEDCGGASTAFTHPRLSNLFYSFYVNPWHRNVLMGWISGPDTGLFESAPEEDLKIAAMEALRKFTQIPNIPLPKQVIRSRWESEDEFLGSYSYYSMAADRSDSGPEDIARPLTRGKLPVVQFAGEATQVHQFQTTHGALLSGLREADRLNAALLRKGRGNRRP